MLHKTSMFILMRETSTVKIALKFFQEGKKLNIRKPQKVKALTCSSIVRNYQVIVKIKKLAYKEKF